MNIFYFFFLNDTATTEIYTLSLHDALPISSAFATCASPDPWGQAPGAISKKIAPASPTANNCATAQHNNNIYLNFIIISLNYSLNKKPSSYEYTRFRFRLFHRIAYLKRCYPLLHFLNVRSMQILLTKVYMYFSF